MFKKIVVAVDGSDHANAAIAIAADIATKYQSQLHLLHVPEVQITAIAVGAGAVTIPVNQEETAARAEVVVKAAIEAAQAAGCTNVVTDTLQGDPAEAILDKVEQLGADLLVSGRRGLGKLQGLLLGSVSQKLASHATCAVLTVK
jgi:nucleotide-binding universal stress UspA family protein